MGAILPRSLRLDHLPVVRRAVDAALAGVLLARVVTSTAIVHASPVPPMEVRASSERPGLRNSQLSWQALQPSGVHASEVEEAEPDAVDCTVQRGDTLSGIAFAFYGDAAQEDRIFEANLGRPQIDGRQFNRHGLILPGLETGDSATNARHRGGRW